MTREQVEQAIQWIEEAKESHTLWIDFFEENPEQAHLEVEQVVVSGDDRHHKEWVERYNEVLELLDESLQEAKKREEIASYEIKKKVGKGTNCDNCGKDLEGKHVIVMPGPPKKLYCSRCSYWKVT